MRQLLIAVHIAIHITIVAALLCAPAFAQKAVLTDAAKGVIATGTWEFSNADRDKNCRVTFRGDAAAAGFKLEFEPACAGLFPLVRDIAGWKYPEDDLLYLIDAQGKAVIEFSEVEDGIFEAPTPGIGVVFLQNPAAAGPAPVKKPADIAGDWIVKRGERTVCALTLAAGEKGDTFPLTIKPGCDPAITRLGFAQWRIDSGELDLLPANGEPWRFEETDGVWRRLSETDQMTLDRQ
jgi:hypothetical protein